MEMGRGEGGIGDGEGSGGEDRGEMDKGTSITTPVTRDVNVWNLVIDLDGQELGVRGVGLAVALCFDVLTEIRELLKIIVTQGQSH